MCSISTDPFMISMFVLIQVYHSYGVNWNSVVKLTDVFIRRYYTKCYNFMIIHINNSSSRVFYLKTVLNLKNLQLIIILYFNTMSVSFYPILIFNFVVEYLTVHIVHTHSKTIYTFWLSGADAFSECG